MAQEDGVGTPSSDIPPEPGLSGRFRTVLLRPGALFPARVRRSSSFLFVATLFSTLACVFAGNLLFAEGGGLIAVSLLAFSLQEELVGILEENRDVVWAYGASPRQANTRLAVKTVMLFLGMFIGFAVAAVAFSEASVRGFLGPQLSKYAGESARIQGIDFGTPERLLGHNAVVLLGCFLFSFLFRTGGALLVLGWNASVWGAVYGFIVRMQPSGRAWYGVRVLAATMPHIVLEAGGYVFAALAGVFVSKGLAKYPLGTSSFHRVLLASLELLALGLALVAGAAYVEAWGTPWLSRQLFQR